MQAIFNTSLSGVNACYIQYLRGSNLLKVADANGSNWSSGIVPGVSGTTGNFNPYCTINGIGSSVSASGAQISVTASITFQPAFAGAKSNYLIAYDQYGLNSGWQPVGTWTIPSPPALTITTDSLSGGTVGASYGATLAASGGIPGYTWTLAGGALPSGLSLSSSGVISGTPTGAGTSSFTVRVTDSASATTTKALSISVLQGLTITTSSPLPSGTVGVSYSGTLAASGGAPGYTWTTTGGALPSGLSLSSTGTISGTPTAAGTSNFTVKVTDSASATATKALSVNVVSGLAITTSWRLSGGIVGASYSTTLAASGGTPGYTWAIASGALPSGLSLSTGGTISGAPTSAGTSNFTVQVTDSVAATTAKALSISVVQGLTITTPAQLPSGALGVQYSATLAANGGTPAYTWAMAGGALPSGLNLSSNGTISGTPSVAGSSSFTVRVTDSASATATLPLSLSVTSVGLSITTTSFPVATVGVSFGAQPTAIGGTQPFTWTVASGAVPAGLTLSSSGALAGTPSSAGTSVFTVRVTDSASATATRLLSLTVSAAGSQVRTVEYIRGGGRVIAIENSGTGPLLSCAAVNLGVVNTYFSSGTPTVTGGTPPYTFSLATGSLLGLSLNSSTGSVSGTPTAAGNFSIQVRDANNVPGSTCPFLIAQPTLTISTTALSGGQVGNSYSATLSATGGTPGYTWAVSGGALPSGLSLYSNGTISGTPSSQGTFNFTVRVTDSTSATATQPLSITVSPAGYANLYISTSSLRVYDPWALWMYSNIPNSSFTLCVTIDNVSQGCRNDYQPTNGSGYWTLSGTTPRQTGVWREWVVFPNGTTSNTIVFTVSDWATLSISSSTLHTNDPWTLWVSSSIPNTLFRICANINNGGWSCTPYQYSTGGAGSQTLNGTTPAQPGNWEERAEFLGLTTTSNSVYFTVINP